MTPADGVLPKLDLGADSMLLRDVNLVIAGPFVGYR
jgi:hypothetical protein